jgi:hypothetical protein
MQQGLPLCKTTLTHAESKDERKKEEENECDGEEETEL